MQKGIQNVDWKRRAPWIISYLQLKKQGSRPKATPVLMRKYGVENFKEKKGALYIFERKVVLDEKEKKQILERLEQGVGGYHSAYSRIQRTHFGISLSMVRKFFNTSERRQLKQKKGSVNAQKTFIATPRAGAIQVDNMFFRGSGGKLITVFGIVEVFSRWVYYVVIPNKTPWSTGQALKDGVEALEKLAGTRVYQCRTDSGTEFMHDPRNKQVPKSKQKIDFRGYCKQRKILLISKKQPARIVESMNLRLRTFVERIQYASIKELKALVAQFCEEKNLTKHSATGMAPLDALKLDAEKTKKLAKRQLERGRKRIAKGEKPGKPLKKLEKGSLVRLQLVSEKTTLGHAGVKPTWSPTIYRVVKKVGSTRGGDRFKIVVDATDKKLDGLFLRWRLQSIVRPTHQMNVKIKYQPGEVKKGDVEREEEARRPDIAQGSTWADKKSYKDAQDTMDDDGEEFVPKGKVEVLPKRPKRPRRVKAKKEMKMIGRKIFIYRDGVEFKSAVVVLVKHRGYYIVRFRDKSISAVDAGKGGDVARTTADMMSAKTVEKYIAAGADTVEEVKKEIDEILDKK